MTAETATTPPVAMLRRDHPGVDAPAWVAARRALLVARAAGSADVGLAVSSGCAASGARTHAGVLADDAAHALARLDAGTLTRCEVCDALLPWERLDAAPAAVRCTGCARADAFDDRWCR